MEIVCIEIAMTQNINHNHVLHFKSIKPHYDSGAILIRLIKK